jgi:ectoine hydroxylase-related dioxygenase (phytanoyl-CoA dioxygenase family)
MTPFKATLFEKTGKSNWLVAWHQDIALPVKEVPASADWGAPSIKSGRMFALAPPAVLAKILAVRIHLDASTRRNGPLRVIPGSHAGGILSDDEIRHLVTTVDHHECLSDIGGVVAMRPLALHASSKILSDEPRRVLHIEYAETLDITPGVRLALS